MRARLVYGALAIGALAGCSSSSNSATGGPGESSTPFDSGKPDGTPRKLMDSTRLMGLGWKPGITLREGIKQTYDWYLKQKSA